MKLNIGLSFSQRAPGADGRQIMSTGCRRVLRLMQIIARERGNDMKTQINCGTQINSFYKEDTKNAVKKSRILRQKTALFIFGFCTKIQKTTKKQSSAFLVF